MQWLYDSIINFHLQNYRQMCFLSGPRQTGKTTIAKAHAHVYLNWDDDKTRQDILAGQQKVGERCGLQVASLEKRIIAFDEIHKYLG